MTPPPDDQPIDGFSHRFDHAFAEITLPVYRSNAGTRPLIVLHELPGMTRSFVGYCQRMAERDFRVYMPLMFGKPREAMGNAGMAKFCLSRTFRELYKKNSDGVRPFTTWLLDLARHVIAENDDRKIGVIGMCLTGAFSLVTFAEKGVAAAVCCQPSYPFSGGDLLGMSDDQRQAAVAGAQQLPEPCATGYRYNWDWRSRSAHIDAIEKHFGSAYERTAPLPGFGHSVVTGKRPSPAVFDRIVTFLDGRL